MVQQPGQGLGTAGGLDRLHCAPISSPPEGQAAEPSKSAENELYTWPSIS